jgi:GNAT superfamily N-acetyltransferase
MSDSFVIREATPTDVPAILNLIRELAMFEKLEDQVSATESQLLHSLFSPTPVAHALVATTKAGEPAGFALYFFNYSTFLARAGLYLEDLFVLPKYRSGGLGRRLLARLAQIASARNCGRMEWSVLNWNKNAIRFYESLGATPQSEWTVYRLTQDGISQLANKNPIS